MRGDLTRAGVQLPTMAEEAPEARLFGNRKATKALLTFIATTGVGVRQGEQQQEAERMRRDDEWDMESSEEGERGGEG